MVRHFGFSDGTPNHPPELCVFEFLTFKNVLSKGRGAMTNRGKSVATSGPNPKKMTKTLTAKQTTNSEMHVIAEE